MSQRVKGVFLVPIEARHKGRYSTSQQSFYSEAPEFIWKLIICHWPKALEHPARWNYHNQLQFKNRLTAYLFTFSDNPPVRGYYRPSTARLKEILKIWPKYLKTVKNTVVAFNGLTIPINFHFLCPTRCTLQLKIFSILWNSKLLQILFLFIAQNP